ncbi:MAG: FAD-dependent oxidoreductase [Lachnospiraceae bacterium]|nr:FAD-dependent oxidoreductase [Lachnospiraceae bacterium]
MKKVIIIGAGPAGITAGYELLKQSNEYEVTILEESPYAGGISRTEVYNGHRMDIGGHRFFSKSQEVNDWWAQIMPMQGAPAYDDDKLNRDVPLEQGGPDPAKEDRVMLNRSRISHIYYKRKFFEYPVKMNADTIKNMGFGTTMQAGFSYLGSMVAKKPVNSLENFYINQFGRKLYSMFFEGYTEKLWGRHPRDIDPSWGAQRTKGLSITEIVKDATRKALHKEAKEVNTSLIGAFKYPKLGPGQLWECAAADFEKMGGSIHYNCRVIRINTEGDKVDSVTCAVDGIVIEEKADIVISSMPIKDLIIGMNNVPANVQEVARKLPYRDFVTVGLLVPKLRISNTTYMRTLGNVIPDTWIYVQDPGIKMGRIQIFNNWSPYLVENPEKTVWVGLEYFCNEGDRYWNMTDEEWIQFATKELVHMGILSESTKVLDAHKLAVKKAYPAYFDTYSRFDEVRTYLDGFENLYCVGRNGQHRYNNMDHSMITSFEAVKNIINGVKDKSNIWNVNTEQEYHEEKAAPADDKATEVKPSVTSAPVPPVKQESKTTPEPSQATSATVTSVKAEEPVQKEEELQAAVKAVPAPPVRKQLRRNPVPKAAEDMAVAGAVAVAESSNVSAMVQETTQVSEQTAETTQVIVPNAMPEPEIHESKSRSIWDDVAYAEATAEVKTAPIRFKTVEEAHAAVKGTTVEKVSVHKDEKKVDEVKTDVVETVAETVKETTEPEKKDSVEIKEEKPKKTTRGRKKEQVKNDSDAKVSEDKKSETVTSEEVKEDKPKKTGRTGRKKTVKEQGVTEAVETIAEEVKTESVPEQVIEETKKEDVLEPVAEATKTEVMAETVDEVSETKAENATAVDESVKEEKPKKATRTRRKKAVETQDNTEVKETVSVAEEKAEAITETLETAEEVAAEKMEAVEEVKVVTAEILEETKVESVEMVENAEADAEELSEEVKAEAMKATEEVEVEAIKTMEEAKVEAVEETEEIKTEVAETAEEPKRPSRSTSGKTIAGRSSSRRVSDSRNNTNRRKAEDNKKPVSNIGKQAVVGSMKGTVIKSNVIQKKPEENKKAAGSGRR